MPRKSLRPNLNQIRAWVRQGRTDAWVAHQLDVSVRDIEQFKRQNELVAEQDAPEGTLAADYPDEIDLRAEDDALIAAELEAAEIEAQRAREEEAEADVEAPGEEASEGGVDDGRPVPRRGILRGHVHCDRQTPRGARPVELDQLPRGEAPAQPAAQLGHQRIGDALQARRALGSLGCQPPLALLPGV